MSEPAQGRAAVVILALLLASTIVFEPPVARADPTTFSPPALLANSTIQYLTRFNTTLTFTVGPIGTALDVFGQEVAAYSIREDSGDSNLVQVHFVSPHTGTVETRYSGCTVSSSDRCMLAGWSWSVQGSAALLGTTALQGRTFSVGDHWTLGGFCAACNGTVKFDILSPTATSPAGTDYVVNVTGRALGMTRGLLHMSANSPYPLLYEERSFRGNLTILDVKLGDAPIPVVSPPGEKSYSPPLSVVPFVGDRPVEGSPATGNPAWSEARNATGPDLLDREATSRLLEVAYARDDMRAAPGTPPYFTQFTYFSKFARPGLNDTHGTLTAGQSAILGAIGLGPRQWNASGAEQSSATPLGTCVTVAPVLWDAVRYGRDLGLLNDFTGWKFANKDPFVGCEGYRFHILGTRFGPGATESVVFNVDGTLVSADVLPTSSDPIPLPLPWPSLT